MKSRGRYSLRHNINAVGPWRAGGPTDKISMCTVQFVGCRERFNDARSATIPRAGRHRTHASVLEPTRAYTRYMRRG